MKLDVCYTDNVLWNVFLHQKTWNGKYRNSRTGRNGEAVETERQALIRQVPEARGLVKLTRL